MAEIKGFCRDCRFRRQEWVLVEDENGQQLQVDDFYCGLCGVFKRRDGYCDMWELED